MPFFFFKKGLQANSLFFIFGNFKELWVCFYNVTKLNPNISFTAQICFSLKISSLNVTKSAGNCGFDHIKNFIFCTLFGFAWIFVESKTFPQNPAIFQPEFFWGQLRWVNGKLLCHEQSSTILNFIILKNVITESISQISV